MDDDYELVSKGTIATLKEENRLLKSKLENSQNISKTKSPEIQIDKLLPQIIQALHDESQKEREEIRSELNQIKDINKTTLDNILHKNEELESKFEGMFDMMKELISSMAGVIEVLSKKDSNDEQMNMLKEIKLSLDEIKYSSTIAEDSEVDTKLRNIETFMTNLRVLLGQIKPTDFSVKSTPTNNFGNLPPPSK